MEAKSETNKTDIQFPVYPVGRRGGTTVILTGICLRKPFTAATFDGMDFFGMDYKVATTIMSSILVPTYFKVLCHQDCFRIEARGPVEVHGMLRSPCRTRFSLLRITPPTFNVFALFFNGLALGCMWGVIFEFHRRTQSYRYIGQLAGGKYGGELRNG